jgi:formiminotetrahydrofolate cyclodeaminase
MLMSSSVHEFLEHVASDRPAPGGGSVAALAGALGAALTSMVCRLTIGKKKYAAVQSEMEGVLAQAEEVRARLEELVEKDTEAFNGVMTAYGLPRESEAEKKDRAEAIQTATKRATAVPLEVMQLCSRAAQLARVVAEKGNVNSISDAGVAALLIQTACAGAALNVYINLASLQEGGFVQQTKEEVQEIQSAVERTCLDTVIRVESAVR